MLVQTMHKELRTCFRYLIVRELYAYVEAV